MIIYEQLFVAVSIIPDKFLKLKSNPESLC